MNLHQSKKGTEFLLLACLIVMELKRSGKVEQPSVLLEGPGERTALNPLGRSRKARDISGGKSRQRHTATLRIATGRLPLICRN